MEDVLPQYQLPYDPHHSSICFDERPCFLIQDVGGILPMSPGKAKRYHYEYQKNGPCCVFLAVEPHTGFRSVEVRERRTASDYADFMQTLLARHYQRAEALRLVQDNLNTHTPGSFYEVLPPAEAFALAQKFEPHYTPKKGSWLNMRDVSLRLAQPSLRHGHATPLRYSSSPDRERAAPVTTMPKRLHGSPNWKNSSMKSTNHKADGGKNCSMMTSCLLDRSAYWTVPLWTFGSRELPRLFLGDRGFLARYGSTLPLHQITARMRYALANASLGLAAGDERCLTAAQHATRQIAPRSCTVYHTDIPIAVGSTHIHLGRCMASLLHIIRTWVPEFIERDPIIGKFLRRFAPCRPYSQHEVSALVIAGRKWEQEADCLRRFRPAFITVGGDYLDFALAVGRSDLAQAALLRYRQLCQELRVPLVLATYTGWLTIGSEPATLPPTLYDGLLIPLNPNGLGMMPDRATLLSWAHHFGKPLVAMHPLGSGQIEVTQALRYAFTEARAAAVIVGASTYDHIDALVRAGRAVLRGSW